MKQASLNLNLSVRKMRKPWAELVDLITPYESEGKSGRPRFSRKTMKCMHFMRQWFSLSDPAMEEAFFDTPLSGGFAQLDGSMAKARIAWSSVLNGIRVRGKPKGPCVMRTVELSPTFLGSGAFKGCYPCQYATLIDTYNRVVREKRIAGPIDGGCVDRSSVIGRWG
jgi:hypothetical protein